MNLEEKVIGLISRVLEVSPDKLDEDTAIGDIIEWDSLRHLVIVTEIEKEFKIMFEPEEIMELEDVSDFVGIIEEKTNS
jgi:acyl carrier protein